MFIFVCLVSGKFILNKNNAEEQQTIEEAKAKVTPEQLKAETLMAISEIVLRQFIENIMLNLEITPIEDKQSVVISLQASEFIEENTLLKDSYNLLKELQHVNAVNDVTLKWFMAVRNKNTEVLTMSFDEQTLLAINNISYQELSEVATFYEKHEALR